MIIKKTVLEALKHLRQTTAQKSKKFSKKESIIMVTWIVVISTRIQLFQGTTFVALCICFCMYVELSL
jgi:hypothetical protein